MSKLQSLQSAISAHVLDGSSVALGLQLEQMIGAGCVEKVIAAWVGNVMMGQAYNFRRAVENDEIKVFNLTNFTLALALQAGAMGVPFLPTRTALGSDIAQDNEFFAEIGSPFAPLSTWGRPPSAVQPREARQPEKLHAVRALVPDVTVVHVQRADREGNA